MTAGPAVHRQTSSGRYHPLLGTNVEVRVDALAGSDDEAERLGAGHEDAAVQELVRLQAVFSVYDPGSELSRWRAGATDAVSGELRDCLAAAEHWWRVSGGAFHPAAARLRALWLRAEATGELPSDGELAATVADLATLPFAVREDGVERTGDCSGVDLNAI